MADRHQREAFGSRQSFTTTQWSVVLQAGDTRCPDSQAALETLCGKYWPPIYAFIRRRGYPKQQAQDLTQEFFARLLEKKVLKLADPQRGRFRSFLLASVKNFLANEWDCSQTQKRGGGMTHLQLDFDKAETIYLEPVEEKTPEDVYEHRWAITLLEQVLNRLRQEMADRGNTERFENLKSFLTVGGEDLRLRRVAEKLNISENAAKTALYRLRRRFGRLLKNHIAETISDPDAIDSEVRYLFAALEK